MFTYNITLNNETVSEICRSFASEGFADMDKELYTAEETYELTMKDIKVIYA